MSHTLAIKNKDGDYVRFTVPLEVSRYVKQLEAYIIVPGVSKLKEAYPERFAQAPDLLAACEAYHEAVDRLFALLFLKDKNFRPSDSGQPWVAAKQGFYAIKKAKIDITGKSDAPACPVVDELDAEAT